MLSLRDFWRRHRKKVFVTVGVLGGGYFLYKIYNTHRQRLDDLERELASERQNEELIKAQMQAHFENIQRIADTTTFPHVMHHLISRMAEELDLSHLTERLMKGKGQPSSEKHELWDKLKILSFTRLVMALWAMTILSLYIRVQVNILGRHLYLDTARDYGSSLLLENADPIDRDDQQKFLASADFLSTHVIPSLISDMQDAATEVLKGKQLREFFNSKALHESILHILDNFMSRRSPHHWVDCLIPEDGHSEKLATPSSSNEGDLSAYSKFDQLMMETREVLYSSEFGSMAEIALKAVVDTLIKDMEAQPGGSLASGMQLARLVPRVAQMSPAVLEEPRRDQFIQIIGSLPEVELFFTLLYSNMPIS